MNAIKNHSQQLRSIGVQEEEGQSNNLELVMDNNNKKKRVVRNQGEGKHGQEGHASSLTSSADTNQKR